MLVKVNIGQVWLIQDRTFIKTQLTHASSSLDFIIFINLLNYWCQDLLLTTHYYTLKTAIVKTTVVKTTFVKLTVVITTLVKTTALRTTVVKTTVVKTTLVKLLL